MSPSISIISSLICNPELIAGEFSDSLLIFNSLNPLCEIIMLNTIIAKIIFIMAPANIIEIFLSGVALEKLLSSSTTSSSPNRLTNPPIGKSLNEYLVSLPFLENISGPIPTENSSTFIPFTFAIIKWPSSWTITNKLKPSIAIIIYIFSSLINYVYLIVILYLKKKLLIN